jgi:hypothetical protein
MASHPWHVKLCDRIITLFTLYHLIIIFYLTFKSIWDTSEVIIESEWILPCHECGSRLNRRVRFNYLCNIWREMWWVVEINQNSLGVLEYHICCVGSTRYPSCCTNYFEFNVTNDNILDWIGNNWTVTYVKKISKYTWKDAVSLKQYVALGLILQSFVNKSEHMYFIFSNWHCWKSFGGYFSSSIDMNFSITETLRRQKIHTSYCHESKILPKIFLRHFFFSLVHDRNRRNFIM